MTDWRALCEELTHEVEQYAEDRGDLMPECANRARAALAQPEPERYCQMIVDVQALAKRWNLPVPWLVKLVSEVLAEAAGIEGLKKPSIPPALPDFEARAALAELEPEVVGPTDEELLELWQSWNLGWDPQKGMVLMPHFAEYARAVLARWGNRQGSLDSSPASPAEGEQRHPAPVPVAERLPGPEDLNDKGECWEWDPASDAWVLIRPIGLTFRTGPWLPATALPLPATEAQP